MRRGTKERCTQRTRTLLLSSMHSDFPDRRTKREGKRPRESKNAAGHSMPIITGSLGGKQASYQHATPAPNANGGVSHLSFGARTPERVNWPTCLPAVCLSAACPCSSLIIQIGFSYRCQERGRRRPAACGTAPSPSLPLSHPPFCGGDCDKNDSIVVAVFAAAAASQLGVKLIGRR